MSIGTVKFIRPANPRLKPLIKGYYTHTAQASDFFAELTFFQNITTSISIYEDAICSSKGRLRKQHFKLGEGYSAILVGLVDKYQEVEFYGPLNRVAIVFYPGGLNHFITTPLSELLQLHYSVFDYWQEPFKTFLPRVYNEPSLEGKRELLDRFFLHKFHPFNEPQLLKAINILVYTPEFPKVNDLARQLNLSRRTLLRKFRKHTGYSIEEYISVIKFRRALWHYQQDQKQVNLSNIAYDSGYYDQADFNHHFKFRSGLSPTALFKQLQIVDNTLFWKL